MVEINVLIEDKIDVEFIKKTVEKFLEYYGKKETDVSVAIVGGDEIKKINKKYRKKDAVTDVLSFAGEEGDLGEIVICYDQIKKQAREFKNSAEKELEFILVHGLLHLLGYDDKTKKEAEEMERKGNEFLIRNL